MQLQETYEMKSLITLLLLPFCLVCLAAGNVSAQDFDSCSPCWPPSAGTISRDEIDAKYADEDSKFVVLEGKDGIRVHYKDQGSGSAILLVHSSVGDLKDWNPWVEVLSQDYRVVRFDLPAFGLTGPVPSGNYSIDRFLGLIDGLMDQLGIERFAIVGVSYGGPVAFRYAATRTDRVSALVLMSSAGIEYGGHGGTTERDRDPNVRFTPQLLTTEMTESLLKRIINDPSKVTPEIVQRKTDYANIVGRDRESFLGTRMYERGNPERVLSHVRAPSLVLWGGASAALSPETAHLFANALVNAASVKVKIYDGGGHLIHIERPEETVNDAKAFFDKNLQP
jgi:pimeloyl-ACP methyl ester carboxylesterase